MKNFTDLNLSPELSSAISELGFTETTPVQELTLPILLEGPTDFLGLAATGTGKTAAYGIPMIERITDIRLPAQILVMCPTRELALQVTQQLNLIGKFKGVKAVPIYGGSSYGDQIRGLKQGAQIVVATPGRLIDHLERGTVTLDNVSTIVLDEADEMISMGFKEAIETILENVPNEECNTWLFSATMSRDVRRVADRFLREPKMVQINKTEMLSGTVEQIYYKVKESDKPDILCKLIDQAPEFYGLIFCQTKSLVVDLTQLLVSRGYKVDSLHGDKDQNQRERTMMAFRSRRVSILVCTDVACRGLDVKDLTHVVNYSIPRELDNYVHRIGRTGRGGKAGLALSLVTQSHMPLIGRIEKMTSSTIKLGTIPTRKDIAMKKIGQVLEQFQATTNHQKAIENVSPEWKAAIDTMSKEEIVARFFDLSFSDLFATTKVETLLPGAPQRGSDDRRGGDRRDGGGRRDGRRGGGDRGDRGPRRDYGGRSDDRRGGSFGGRDQGGGYDRPSRDRRDDRRSSY